MDSKPCPCQKKEWELHVCVDFRDLNNACPKDDFLLPVTEIMVGATTEHEVVSFMDRSSRYNQIRMTLSNEEMTAFRTPKGIYCYKAFTVHLVAKMDPIKYVLSKPIISGCLAKWVVLPQQYNIVYIFQNVIKGQAQADFLADHPIPSDWKFCEDLSDDEIFFTEVMEPWTMYFDGAM
ncbi:uncharacterized protein E5676_scaffold718G00310 [Cucumis melo var. makuwa]|uniref:Reverse transcriptase domain-containing protein n=1 Tax=Cucumis melo var. makuwa TaxID=1194695 RepID=A0A5A7SJ64_CUCMM|nr:uncharacterized protein E6C27_scaffold1204G00330 [Cucumis melo var. makuwa]TYK06472.1 uncharacterized protein E5676_scaffold718G00310 [Cucumis melo var. makuwa]